jgi:hypothetical protein
MLQASIFNKKYTCLVIQSVRKNVEGGWIFIDVEESFENPD